MNLLIEAIEIDPADYENGSEEIKSLAEVLSELLDALKRSL